MSAGYVTLGAAEKREWLHARGQIRRGPHKFTRKILHWPYCERCGLVRLKNAVSLRAAAAQCEWEE